MSYQVFIFRDENRIPELMELFATGLGETHVGHWKWRLFSEIGEMNPIAVVCEAENGRLDGMMTAIPVIYGNGRTRILQMCDWVVRPEARGQGLLSMMYRFITEEYQNRGYDGLAGFGNDQSKPVLKKYHYYDYGTFQSWSTPFHLYLKKDEESETLRNGLKFRFSKACPEMKVPVRENRLFRDQAYLVWKYDENPDVAYTWLTVWKDQKCLGYLVYTLTKGRVRTVANIYDWEFDDRYAEAFTAAIKLIRRRANSVCIWGKYGEREEALLQAAGMKKKEIGSPLSVKAYPDKSIPEDLVLTRVDTDF